jgi:F0F1-type ATP synthase assembly protein I
MSERGKPQQDRVEYARNMAIAAILGQVGCLTLAIVIGSLIGGLWLDNQLDSKPIFTIVLLLGSIPITIILMFWVVRKGTAKLTPASKQANTIQEDAERGA